MRMRDWDERGFDPPFGQQGEWLSNVLDRAWSPEAASYAVDVDRVPPQRRGGGEQAGERPRRYLVASSLGLLDGRFVPDAAADARLATVLIPWSDVRGLELLSETTLDEAFRHRTTWRMRLAQPEMDIGDPPSDAALLEFWHECALRAGRPPFEEPKQSE